MQTNEASSPTWTVVSSPAGEVCSIWSCVWTCTPFNVMPYTAGTKRLVIDHRDEVRRISKPCHSIWESSGRAKKVKISDPSSDTRDCVNLTPRHNLGRGDRPIIVITRPRPQPHPVVLWAWYFRVKTFFSPFSEQVLYFVKKWT